MLKYYLKTTEALKRLRTDKDGVVSFEYVIVAACIIAVVSLGFGTGGPLQTALTNAITSIGTALTTAVTGA
jgi:pilus assembly protein Flp/PilA